MDNWFRIGLLLGLAAIAVALFQYAENGRYQLTNSGRKQFVVDTRTGEFWTEEGNHFEPRTASITLRTPWIDNAADGDQRTNDFRLCLQRHIKTPSICLEEKKLADKLARENLILARRTAINFAFEHDPAWPHQITAHLRKQGIGENPEQVFNDLKSSGFLFGTFGGEHYLKPALKEYLEKVTS